MAVSLSGGGEPETINQLSVGRAGARRRGAGDLLAAPSTSAPSSPASTRSDRAAPGGDRRPHPPDGGDGSRRAHDQRLGVREGIVLGAIGAHDRAELADDPRALRRASVLSLCRRSNWRQPHARKVAALALALFDATAGCTNSRRATASCSSSARCCTTSANTSAGSTTTATGPTHRERRSARLLPRGGTDARTIGRFHVRGTPRASSAGYSELSTEERRRVLELLAAAAHRRRPRRLALRRHLDPRPRGRVGEEPRQRGGAETIVLRAGQEARRSSSSGPSGESESSSRRPSAAASSSSSTGWGARTTRARSCPGYS